MKIIDSDNELIAEGEYLYLEGGRELNGDITFHIQMNLNGKDLEIHFYPKTYKKLKEILTDLTKVLENKENP